MKSVWFVLWFAVGVGLWAETPVHWKAVLMSGYATDGDGQPLANWDNARDRLQALLLNRGLEPGDLRLLTDDPLRVGTAVRGTVLGEASRAGLRQALADLRLGDQDGLILFLTSHGRRHAGWLLEHDGWGDPGVVTPADLADDLNDLVADRPAVVLISSCFSGQFLEGTWGVTGPFRVVLAAARSDRSSFGCGAGTDLPEWDESLIRLWTGLEPGFSWSDLARSLAADIAAKEEGFADSSRSWPQASVGFAVGFGGP